MAGSRTWLGGGLLAALLAFPLSALADDAGALAKILTGNYSTERQASTDPARPAELLRITPIWTGRSDGPWMYVERADAAAANQPTRQEIWQLKFQPHKGGTEIRIHTLPDPEAVSGAWREPEKIRAVLPERLTRVEGCELLLQRRQEFAFSGGTPGMGCKPSYSDADYVLIQASIEPQGLRLAERGYDSSGRQISGPREEGLRFDKVAIGDVPIKE
ncbi:chromophore lyase CpcT/CpeT [Indioceanicola profundi]|uniref:chromophore lyase CpcT/CpeT n=1 Tax=Indioceanicola profundi TaxID=2220096 RepID=UPI000E6ADCA5|nr:chromophore lyase CpcT/CpeT [Indioceanicola profundi]